MSLDQFLFEGEVKDYEVHVEPDLDFVANTVNSRKKSYVIVIYLACEVHYEGRAKAELDFGNRLLILKPDGTLLIHEAEKREPKIWNPPSSRVHASVEGDLLIIKSVRLKPPETVIIESPYVFFMGLFKCGIGAFVLKGSEKDMVDRVCKNPDIIEKGLKIIKREYKTLVGEIDILAEDSNGNIVVLEFKRSIAGPEAVHQLKRYVEFISQLDEFKNKIVRGILVSPGITPSAYKYLKMYNLEFKRLKPY